MAAPTTTDAWDEYLTRVSASDITVVDSWRIGLYYDATDLVTSTDTGDPDTVLTTIPSGGGYTDKTVVPSTDVTVVANAADYQHDVADQTWSSLSFTAATNVDAWYMSITVQLTGVGAGETVASEHLMAVGTLTGGPYDLQNYTDFTVQDIGVRQTQV